MDGIHTKTKSTTIVIIIFHPKLCPYVYRVPREYLTDTEYKNLIKMQGLVVGRNTHEVDEMVISLLEEKLDMEEKHREFSNIDIDGILYPDMRGKNIRFESGPIEIICYSHRDIAEEYETDSDSSIELSVDVSRLDIDINKII